MLVLKQGARIKISKNNKIVIVVDDEHFPFKVDFYRLFFQK